MILLSIVDNYIVDKVTNSNYVIIHGWINPPHFTEELLVLMLWLDFYCCCFFFIFAVWFLSLKMVLCFVWFYCCVLLFALSFRIC